MSFPMPPRTWPFLAACLVAAGGLLSGAQAEDAPKKPAEPANKPAATKRAEARQAAAAKQAAAKPAAKPAAPRLLREDEVPYPPELPGGKLMVSDTSPDFLKATTDLKEGVTIAKAVPTVDFMYYPNQSYPGKPWSNWGDSVAVGGKYYSAFGDHLAIGRKGGDDPKAGTGTGFVFEYDPATKKLRELCNTTKVLNMPEGHYTPGKIHSRLDMGSDGKIYFSTHRGSPAAAVDKNHYEGDWIFRCDPKTAKTEIVSLVPVAKHSCPNSVLDPDRLIFYGGTAQGPDSPHQGIWFFAYDCKNNKLLYSGPDGPARYMMFARSTGRLYYVPGNGEGQLMRYDPKVGGTPVPVAGIEMGTRSATQETPDGIIYTVSQGQGSPDSIVYAFDTKTEKVTTLGSAPVGANSYIASLDADPTGRYLYYVAGAHGGSERDGTPVVQFDVKTKQRKVIAFLHPFYQDKYGCAMKGTYGTAVDTSGDKLYITFNVSRGTKAWDCCGLAVVHIPAAERTP